MTKQKENKPKIGLALSSGGLRGLAHVGVIKVLLKNKIPIDYISGSSAGALVGSYLATHGEIDSFEKLLLENSKDFVPLFFDFGFSGGFINGTKINTFLAKILNDTEFSETKIPFYVIATDLVTGQPAIFSSGKLVSAVRGSISVPIIFKPYEYDNKLLVDGGLSDPMPVNILKENGANFTIAVNLYHQNEFKNEKFKAAFSEVGLRSIKVALHNLAKVSVDHADFVLNPDTSKYLSEIKITDYFKPENIKKIISIGEEETLKHLPEIKKLLKIKN